MNQPIDPTTPLPVTLQAQEWNQLIDLLATVSAPWRITNPLMQRITEQVQAAAAAQPQVPLMNGAESHVPN